MDDKANPLLTPVMKAEDDARNRVSNTENEAKNELRAAHERADEIVKAAQDKAREEVRRAVEDARRSGDDEARGILERGEKDIEEMKKKARGRMKEACRVIVVRITGT